MHYVTQRCVWHLFSPRRVSPISGLDGQGLSKEKHGPAMGPCLPNLGGDAKPTYDMI